MKTSVYIILILIIARSCVVAGISNSILYENISTLAGREINKVSHFSDHLSFKQRYVEFLTTLMENPQSIADEFDFQGDASDQSVVFLYCLREYGNLNSAAITENSLIPCSDLLDIRAQDSRDLKYFWYADSIRYVNKVLNMLDEDPSLQFVSSLILADRVMDELIYRPIDASLFDEDIVNLVIDVATNYGPKIKEIDFDLLFSSDEVRGGPSLVLAKQMQARLAQPQHYFGTLHASSSHFFEKYKGALTVYASQGVLQFIDSENIPRSFDISAKTALSASDVEKYFNAMKLLNPSLFYGWGITDGALIPVFEEGGSFVSKGQALKSYLELMGVINGL